MRKILFVLLACFYFFSCAAYAADTPLSFEDPALEQEYKELLEELRCLVCQNQSLADSHAELAQDLRVEVQRLLLQGKTKQGVIDFLVARYGDFVLYRPPLKTGTLLLWLGPFVLLVLAGVVVVFQLRARNTQQSTELSSEQEIELKRLLDESSAEKES